MDFDQSVFNRKYNIDLPVLGDINLSLLFLIEELRNTMHTRNNSEIGVKQEENFNEITENITRKMFY